MFHEFFGKYHEIYSKLSRIVNYLYDNELSVFYYIDYVAIDEFGVICLNMNADSIIKIPFQWINDFSRVEDYVRLNEDKKKEIIKKKCELNKEIIKKKHEIETLKLAKEKCEEELQALLKK